MYEPAPKAYLAQFLVASLHSAPADGEASFLPAPEPHTRRLIPQYRLGCPSVLCGFQIGSTREGFPFRQSAPTTPHLSDITRLPYFSATLSRKNASSSSFEMIFSDE